MSFAGTQSDHDRHYNPLGLTNAEADELNAMIDAEIETRADEEMGRGDVGFVDWLANFGQEQAQDLALAACSWPEHDKPPFMTSEERNAIVAGRVAMARERIREDYTAFRIAKTDEFDRAAIAEEIRS